MEMSGIFFSYFYVIFWSNERANRNLKNIISNIGLKGGGKKEREREQIYRMLKI
jgi:hypothetical protein